MILLLDLDSTLVAQEGCNTLAHWKGVGEQVSVITQQTMDGVMDFNTAFPQKLELIQPSHDDLDTLGEFLLDYVSDDWKKVITRLQKQDITVAILSQWYIRSSLPVAKMLHIDPAWVLALDFIHDKEGWFESLDMSQDLMYYDGKKRVITDLKKRYPDKKIVFSWDSFGDRESWQEADLFVAYTGVVAREKVLSTSKYLAKTPEELYTHLITSFTL